MNRIAILEGYTAPFGAYRKRRRKGRKTTRRGKTPKVARCARKCKGRTKGKFKKCVRRCMGKRAKRRC